MAGCALSAHAESSVQLYGLVDVGMTRVTGLKQGSVTQVASGIMEGTRWGLKGHEDLGGGYRAVFNVESRVDADTGTMGNRPISGNQVPDRLATATALGLPGALNPAVQGVNASLASQTGVNVDNKLFDRMSYMGLVTPVGAFLAGRQYTPAYEIVGVFDTMETQSALGAGQAASLPASIDIRLSNTVQYRIQTGGVNASVMLGAGETGNSNANSRFWGAMARYQGQGYALGIGYNKRNNEAGQPSLTNTALGASVNVGPGKLSTLFVRNRDDHPSNLASISTLLTPSIGAAYATLVQGAYSRALQQNGTLFHLGYRFYFGDDTLTVAYNSHNDKTAANADVRSYGAAYTHALSKRTDINAVVARVNNHNTAQLALGGNAYLGGYTAAAGVDSTSLALGIRHRF